MKTYHQYDHHGTKEVEFSEASVFCGCEVHGRGVFGGARFLESLDFLEKILKDKNLGVGFRCLLYATDDFSVCDVCFYHVSFVELGYICEYVSVVASDAVS